MEQQPNRIPTRHQRANYVRSSCVPFTGPYKRRSHCYTRLLPHFVYTRRLYCLRHHLVVSGCAVIGCPTLWTKTSQTRAECSIITRPIFTGWREWVWCTRLTHYRTVCSVGMCFTATASLVHQLMCTHSPVTVCCVVVCGSPRAEGLTVPPAGRDVVDMVSFLADS